MESVRGRILLRSSTTRREKSRSVAARALGAEVADASLLVPPEARLALLEVRPHRAVSHRRVGSCGGGDQRARRPRPRRLTHAPSNVVPPHTHRPMDASSRVVARAPSPSPGEWVDIRAAARDPATHPPTIAPARGARPTPRPRNRSLARLARDATHVGQRLASGKKPPLARALARALTDEARAAGAASLSGGVTGVQVGGSCVCCVPRACPVGDVTISVDSGVKMYA